MVPELEDTDPSDTEPERETHSEPTPAAGEVAKRNGSETLPQEQGNEANEALGEEDTQPGAHLADRAVGPKGADSTHVPQGPNNQEKATPTPRDDDGADADDEGEGGEGEGAGTVDTNHSRLAIAQQPSSGGGGKAGAHGQDCGAEPSAFDSEVEITSTSHEPSDQTSGGDIGGSHSQGEGQQPSSHVEEASPTIKGSTGQGLPGDSSSSRTMPAGEVKKTTPHSQKRADKRKEEVEPNDEPNDEASSDTDSPSGQEDNSSHSVQPSPATSPSCACLPSALTLFIATCLVLACLVVSYHLQPNLYVLLPLLIASVFFAGASIITFISSLVRRCC